MTARVHATQVEVGEQQRRDGDDVAADEEPHAQTLSTVNVLRWFVMAVGTRLHRGAVRLVCRCS